ncbi:hypothetical protein C0991_004943 [Blastosporella zonata]|nr:hypothetical protein C0991_004943 [Blastosporella zonata]
MKDDIGGVNGVKESMSAHILGKGSSGKGCPNASKRAQMIAQQMKGSSAGQSKQSHDSVDSNTKEFDGQKKRAKTKVLTKVERQEIVDCQVGVERNPWKKEKLEDDANTHCDLIDDGGFWRHLKDGHSKPEVALAMAKRVKKQWAALDQPIFVLALVLNPFEGMDCFGDRAEVTQFSLQTILIQVQRCFIDSQLETMTDIPKTYRCVKSRPSVATDPSKVQRKEKELCEAFLSYLSSTGLFEDWKDHKEMFQQIHHADLLEPNDSDDDTEKTLGSKLIKSRSGWRTAMAQWIEKERADSDNEVDEPIMAPQRRHAKWLPRSLELLFLGRKDTDIDEQMRRIQRNTAYTEEAWLMELVAAEEADEDRIPDNGELEGSGDKYDG